MSGEGKGGAAIIGAGLIGAVATGARFCDDAARVGRLGTEVVPIARLSDDVLRAGGALRVADDAVVAGRITGAGEVIEEGGRGRWVLDEADAVELTVDIGLEVLGNLEWDSGEVPLTPPIQQLSGMWMAEGGPESAPTAWMCAEPPEGDHRRCDFVYQQGGQMVSAEGLLIVRDGMVCRSILVAPRLPGMTPAESLVALNRHPCEQIIASGGTSLALLGPEGAYRIVWSGLE
ncbi:MAG: hypothetical protein ACI8RZ_001738 [Myxococcota bacterium]|jgi:hypothetical protein